MNANDTTTRHGEKREPRGLAELTRDELERTGGGTLVGSSFYAVSPYLNSQPAPPGCWIYFW